ncbi:MAG: hypothetical protein K9N23_19345 [Akkermansiaceae bacterium]|nr:hypothetical protein [Akkermansiaceae bacterium]
MENKLLPEMFGTFRLAFGGWAIQQLWLFRGAPIVGGALAGIVHPLISAEQKD